MLYDPKWEKPEVKADPFSLESLVAWLETMPADGTYNYEDNHGCMLCQYFRAHGVPVYGLSILGYRLNDDHETYHPYPQDFDAISCDWRNRQTFGAALSRARAILSKDDIPMPEGRA